MAPQEAGGFQGFVGLNHFPLTFPGFIVIVHYRHTYNVNYIIIQHSAKKCQHLYKLNLKIAHLWDCSFFSTCRSIK